MLNLRAKAPGSIPASRELLLKKGFGLGSPTVWVGKLPVTVAIPIRQTKDVDQHLGWDMDLCSKTLKKQTNKKGRGHWSKFLRVALLGFSSDPSLVGHRAFFLLKPKENVFHSSFSYLLDNLDHIEIHLICYSQYSSILF